MKKDYYVSEKADKIYKQKLFAKITKVSLLLLLTVFTVVYFFLYVVYSKGNFIVSLDKNADNRKNVFLSETGNYNDMRIKLSAKSIDYMDNISYNWIPKNVDAESDGAHNGQNYIAYSFYLINYGNETVNYWYQIDIKDTIKKVDQAIRIMIFRNGEKKIYARESQNGSPEKDTTSFYSSDMALLEQVKDFKPGDKDRFTVVIWLEGDDPECIDDIIGGEIKLEMNITEEHIK